LNNNIDENLVKLKQRLDPMLEETNANYKIVKNKSRFEKMWLPLFIYYPFKQLLSLITLGKYGMKISKTQGIAGIVALLGGIIPSATGWIDRWTNYLSSYSLLQICLIAFGLWYLITIVYTFLQMPNWRNKDLFHIDAYRVFRPNEYAIVEPFLGTNFTIESIKDFILRNSNERAIKEIRDLSDTEISLLEDELEQQDRLINIYEQNLIFLNDILIKLNENIQFIADGTLSPQHLYIINSKFCVYEVRDEEFRLITKEFPRRNFIASFNCKEPGLKSEPYVICYSQDTDFYQGEDSYSYKIYLPKQDVHWIITYYPELDDEQTLQALLEDSILKVEDSNLLKTANLLVLLESHCKILSEQQKINS